MEKDQIKFIIEQRNMVGKDLIKYITTEIKQQIKYITTEIWGGGDQIKFIIEQHRYMGERSD